MDDGGLICNINSPSRCCNDTYNGEWYDPINMIITENKDDMNDFYTSNGPNMVLLYKNNNKTGGGVFQCIIPDGNGKKQSVFVGVYSNGTGMQKSLICGLRASVSYTHTLWLTICIGIPNSLNLTFNTPTLTCTSTGGPATIVTWKKNGQDLDMDGAVYTQNKVITDTQTAEYKSTLTLPERSITDFNSQYECVVENSRGYSSTSLMLQGKTDIVP